MLEDIHPPHLEPLMNLMKSLWMLLPAAALGAQGVLFDDFSYASPAGMAAGGWTLRTKPGWPGLAGASWGPDTFSLLADPENPSNRVVRMTARTNGQGSQTQQSQLCHHRKFFEGTYAARIRFNDRAASGPSGDQVVQSFYLISPLEKDLSPKYSELDFEYLPNGGWDGVGPNLFNTSWETVQIEPWKALNQHNLTAGSLNGWHTLVMQVAGGQVKYYVDGRPTATHGGKTYPRVPMSLNFNLWFIREGVAKDTATRVWQEDIDWVLHVQNKVLSPQEVDAAVAGYRKAGTSQLDTVPEPQPALPCDCDM
jgi:hypothetical protein